MVVRKINRVGSCTLTVSLPQSWVKAHNLKFGDEVDVNETVSCLTISPKTSVPQSKKASIHLKSGQPFLRRYLNLMYVEGCNEIEITSEDPLNFDKVRDAMIWSLGFEIVQSGPKHILVRDVAVPKESEFDAMLHKLFVLNSVMAKNILDGMKKVNKLQIDEIEEMENTTNRLQEFCHRVLIRKDIDSRRHTMNTYHFVFELEQIGDHLKRIARIVEKHPASEQTTTAFEKCTKLVEDLQKVYFKPTFQMITEMTDLRALAFEQSYGLFHKKISGCDLEICSLIIGLLTCIKGIEAHLCPAEVLK